MASQALIAWGTLSIDALRMVRSSSFIALIPFTKSLTYLHWTGTLHFSLAKGSSRCSPAQ